MSFTGDWTKSHIEDRCYLQERQWKYTKHVRRRYWIRIDTHITPIPDHGTVWECVSWKEKGMSGIACKGDQGHRNWNSRRFSIFPKICDRIKRVHNMKTITPISNSDWPPICVTFSFPSMIIVCSVRFWLVIRRSWNVWKHGIWFIEELARKSCKSNLVIRQWQCIDEGSLVEGSRF